MSNRIMDEAGICVCPVCGSKRITQVLQTALIKMIDANTQKPINPCTGRRYLSNRDKAAAYDMAAGDGIGCYFYECRKCGWKSELTVE